MGQIEQDILYGDEPSPAAVPSPTTLAKPKPGALVKSKPGEATPEKHHGSETPGHLHSVLDFLKKQAGPLPVYGWGLIGLGTATVITTIVVALRKPY